jgi:ABC-type bacteriocin/lantibiotic exporter with double-glycine peptidase domain
MTPEFIKIALVQAYQQKTQWTCSAACLKAVLAHWGTDVPELTCIEAIGARKGRGAETTQIVEAARKLGFDALEMSFDSIAQAKALTDQNIPIICDIQSFNHPGKGHYVVLTKVDEEVYLMDPNTPGNMRTISVEEMEQRWWDRWMAPPHHVQSHWGIIVAPQGVLP